MCVLVSSCNYFTVSEYNEVDAHTCTVVTMLISLLQSLQPLVQTLVELSKPETIVGCCHEERTTDNKPRLQKVFFEVSCGCLDEAKNHCCIYIVS